MAILPINGINLTTRSKSNSNTATMPFMGILHSNVQAKDTVSFGNIEQEACPKALAMVKEIFTSLTADPKKHRSIDEELKTFCEDAKNVANIIIEKLPLFDELKLTKYKQEFGSLGNTKIYSFKRGSSIYFEQFDLNGKFSKSLDIDSGLRAVSIRVETPADKYLLKKAECCTNELRETPCRIDAAIVSRHEPNGYILESKRTGPNANYFFPQTK